LADCWLELFPKSHVLADSGTLYGAQPAIVVTDSLVLNSLAVTPDCKGALARQQRNFNQRMVQRETAH
jgi:hypothetical protein